MKRSNLLRASVSWLALGVPFRRSAEQRFANTWEPWYDLDSYNINSFAMGVNKNAHRLAYHNGFSGPVVVPQIGY